MGKTIFSHTFELNIALGNLVCGNELSMGKGIFPQMILSISFHYPNSNDLRDTLIQRP